MYVSSSATCLEHSHPGETDSQPNGTWEVTTTDLTGVERILCMLASRRYSVGSFHARRTGEAWQVELDVATDHAGADLLSRRLERIPSTIEVEELK